MIYELAYPSLLNGVSQQTPRERINGQLTQQLNMMSDPVTGLRRRPGLQYKANIEATASPDQVYSQYLQIGSTPVNLFIFTDTGIAKVTTPTFEPIKEFQFEYLKAQRASSIQVTNSSGLGWILNKEQKPVPVKSTKEDPAYSGFITIRTGAFLKQYSFTFELMRNGSAYTTTITYTTPNGSNSGDAAISVPETIASRISQLISTGKTNQNGNDTTTGSHSLNSYVTCWTEGPTIFIKLNSSYRKAGNYIKVTNKSGSTYASSSSAGRVRDTNEIPASIPKQGDGWILAVGASQSAMEYYKWNYSTLAWDECGSYDSYTGIDNMPLQLGLDDSGEIQIKAVQFQGRNAGDDENNPYPHFLDYGITGIGTFLGRTVFLSGAYVCLSASRYPTRTMRSTVTDILDSDAIEVASGSASSASFEHAVQFNKDLILFASTHQAVIPTGSTALTPTNAMLVLTSEQSMDTTARPSVVGQTLMYSTPLSQDYFGVGELTPSEYTNSVYTAQNLTDHIPKYFNGKCRHIISGGSINMALFSSSTNYRQIYVHEYFWSGTQRQQISWHKWSTPMDLCSMHFAKDKIIVVLKGPNRLLICTVDPRATQYLTSINTVAFLDLNTQIDLVDRTGTLPPYLVGQDIMCTSLTEGLQCQPIGFTLDGSTIKVHSSYKQNKINVGIKYKSRVIPNSPIVSQVSYGGGSKRVISDTKDTLLRTQITVQNSGSFGVSVKDDRSNVAQIEKSTLTWASKDLQLGKQKISSVYDVVVPCRTNAHTSEIAMYTDEAKQMNILSLLYLVNIHINRNRKMYGLL